MSTNKVTTSIILITFLLLSGCTVIRPQYYHHDKDVHPPTSFRYEHYEELLAAYVNKDGLVDYAGMKSNPYGLERFYVEIASISPDSHPELFPTENDRLAYWINAYNATVMMGVLHYYPISSVEDVEEPALLFFFPSKSGFFLFSRYTYGGAETSLYFLENSVIRKRFLDPRYHFALNCASMSCPKLPMKPFYPETLENQLQQEAEKFINNPDNVRYDRSNRTLYLSPIFGWYKEDFRQWLEKTYPEDEPSLLAYLLPYLSETQAEILQNEHENMTIEYLDYDWSLNDQSR